MENLYINRHIENRFLRHLKQFPVTALCGPRQSGKTTMLKHLLKTTHEFISLDDLDKRQEAINDPKMFMSRLSGPCVIDEIQYAPNLLSYIKMSVDEDRKPGRFVLTGSQQFVLMKGLSESLAGRVGIVNLFPLHAVELNTFSAMSTAQKFEKAALCGYYPEIFLAKDADASLWHDNYIRTYLERDIRDIYNIGRTGDFRDFMKMMASRAGQLFNITALSGASRTPATTVKRWVSVLEATGIVFILRPFHHNFGRRFSKMPKVFFYDTGLLCGLLGIKKKEQLEDSPFYGQVFENFCVSETVKILSCGGNEQAAHFFRTKKGLEADLLLDIKGETIIAEFKARMSSGGRDIDTLRKVREELKIKGARIIGINMSDEPVTETGDCVSAGAEGLFKMVHRMSEGE